MATQKSGGASGVISARLRERFKLPPGMLGFSNLITPDDKFGTPKFRALIHYTEDQANALGEKLAALEDRLMGEFLKEAGDYMPKKKKTDPDIAWSYPDTGVWVEDRLKEPSEKMATELPYMAFSAKFSEGVSKKTGQPWKITMKAWSANDALLDLAALKLGRGSIVQPIVTVGLFVSPLVKEPCFSIRLEGLRVLKLVQYSGGAPEGVDDADLALIEGEELDDDLSAFAAATVTDDADPSADGDDKAVDKDELPF